MNKCKDCYNYTTWYHSKNKYTYTCAVMGKGKYSIDKNEKCENCKYYIEKMIIKKKEKDNERLYNDI